jgi:hypothetical protein
MSIWKVTVSMTFMGQLNQNRLYVNDQAENGTGDAVCAYIRDHWVNNVKFAMNAGVVFTQVDAVRVGASGDQATLLLLNTHGSQSEETQTCPFAAWVLQFRTGISGRKFRGRAYIPGYRFGDQQFGRITAGGVTIWSSVLLALNEDLTDHGGSNMNLVIHGEHESHDTPVTSIQLRPIMGSMRRRNIGVGV